MNIDIDIYYDGMCPFCHNFVKLTRLKSAYKVNLFNLREFPQKSLEFSKQGYDVDEGMIVTLNDKIYFGHEAVHIISVLSNTQKISGRIYNFLFSNEAFVRYIYPFLRAGRNFTLRMLGRKKILISK